ncbi:hypothetical protein [Sphingomicrobium sediminis]|uniref:Uncharacterized protein n=1 Tax=Sphingomicrobium sediminis TaxID=2950949 RepID=A0A9X2EM91_9SPHN|nr:hypothetical protein [Sphingomicrobium sediminis]MCM8557989.1 hypothetical protein [Sphingomicrobium sediminis]
MDLNELLHRQQVALMKADLADDCTSREAHLAEVADFAGSIADLRQAKAAPPYPAPSGNARIDEWIDAAASQAGNKLAKMLERHFGKADRRRAIPRELR